MFHPSRECSIRPFQIFSFNCSRNHSATPCLTRRTRTVVALTPSMSAGSSVAKSGMPWRESSFSSFSALNMSRPDRSMSSHTTAANFAARGAGFGEQVGHAAVPGYPGVGELLVGVALAAGLQVQAAGLDIPVHGGDEPAGREPVLGGPELPPQGGAGVLEGGGGGPADERDRDRLGRDRLSGGRLPHVCGGCWREYHCSTSMMTAACLASSSRPRFPVATLSLYRTLIPSGLSSSLKL